MSMTDNMSDSTSYGQIGFYYSQVGFYQKYDELERDRVWFCPYDGGKLKTVIIADTSSGNNEALFVPSTKKCGFCGFSI